METTFYILLYIKTPRGFENFARFYIGDDEDSAFNIFDKLKGSTNQVEDCVLQIDLMETKNNLPVNVKLLGCNLDELAENCKLITKEAFKLFALES